MNRRMPTESHPSSSTSSSSDQHQRSPLLDVSNAHGYNLRRSPRLVAPPAPANLRKRSNENVEEEPRPQKRGRKSRLVVPPAPANPRKRSNEDVEEDARPQKRGRGYPSDWARKSYEDARAAAGKLKTNSNDSTEETEESEYEDNSSKPVDMPKIETIRFGDYIVNTWYAAPYPEEYTQNSVLHMCEFCMKHMKSEYVAGRHKKKCNIRHPPGNEIYRDGKISIFEVDGRKNKMYCSNLCLLYMLFLKDKVVYEDVEPFLFYVMTECDKQGCHFIGYFSKEKCSELSYNLLCIMTMPMYQRKGYGQFLIDFSYLLSQKENKCGSPERPLSELGLLSYNSYWKRKLFQMLEKHNGTMTIEDMSQESKMTEDDITAALEFSQLLSYKKLQSSMLRVDKSVIKEYMEEYHSKGYMVLKPDMLQWTPFDYSTIDDQ